MTYSMAIDLAAAATQPVISDGGRTEHRATADEKFLCAWHIGKTLS